MNPVFKTCILICGALTITYYFLISYFPRSFPTQYHCPPNWPENQTRDVQKLIRPNENTYKIVPEDICDNSGTDFLLMIVVTSALHNFKHRQAIRDSWGKALKDKDSKVKIVFLVGEDQSHDHPSSQKNINLESNQNHDVLQASFIESYYNLTIKSLTMLKWFSETCHEQNFEYLMKVDDDTYVNIHQLINLLIDNTHKNLLTGFIHCGMLAQTEGKACLPPFMLTGYNKNYWLHKLIGFHWYPNYIAGPAYLMSKSTANILYRTALSIPAFHMEDVYITGMLPAIYNQGRHSKRIEHSNMPLIIQNEVTRNVNTDEIHPIGDGRFNIDKIELDPCKYANLISSHDLNPNEMVHIHGLLNDLKQTPNYAQNMCLNYSLKAKKKHCFWDMEIY